MNDERAECWNKRLSELMESHGIKSQAQFAKRFNDKYGTAVGGKNVSQPTVSKWMRVGDNATSGKGGKDEKREIPFPPFETMLKIADFFDVSLGYLLGETEIKNIQIEEVAKYLRCDTELVKRMRSTLTDAARMQWDTTEYSAFLREFFSSKTTGRLAGLDQKYRNHIESLNQKNDFFESLSEEEVDALSQHIPWIGPESAEQGFWNNIVDIDLAIKSGAIDSLDPSLESAVSYAAALECKFHKTRFELENRRSECVHYLDKIIRETFPSC